MKNEITNKNFDYSLLEKDTKAKLIWYAAEIRKHGKAFNEAGLAMGKMLAEARELCGDKPFRDWAPAECGCSLRTAYNYISAHTEFGECATVAHIELSAMYELAKDAGAKKKALRLAAKGVTVTQAVARELIDSTRGGGASGGKPSPSCTPGTAKTVPPPPNTHIEAPFDPDEFVGPPDVSWETEDLHLEPPTPSRTTPPKQLDRSAWFKRYDQSIGPLVRLVDTIADGVNSSQCPMHKSVQKHLDAATRDMMEWMGVK